MLLLLILQHLWGENPTERSKDTRGSQGPAFGELHLRGLRLNSTRVCWSWDRSPFLGVLVSPWGWAHTCTPQCPSHTCCPIGRTSVPSLEAEIDFLADVLARQEAPRHHPLQDGRPRSKCSSLFLAMPETPWQPDPAPQAGLPSGAAWAPLTTALSSPAATLAPNSGRQRVASGLREGHLQQDPAGTMAATTLPTTATVQKYPVEASPIPANDNMVLGETLGLRARGFTSSPGKHGLVSPCCQLTCCPLLSSPPGRADRGVHGGRDLGADRGSHLLVQVSWGCDRPSVPCAQGSAFPCFPGMRAWKRGSSPPKVQHQLAGAGGQ